MGKNDEEIGYHKGALTTLAKERAELKRIMDIVEQLMHYHVGELKKMGIDIAKETKTETKKPVKGKKK